MEMPVNEFLVGMQGNGVVVMMPIRGPISKERATALAAWLVMLSGVTMEEFSAVLTSIEDGT